MQLPSARRVLTGMPFLLLLVGCETGPSLATRLQTYVGQPETVLIQGLGVPTRSITTGGVKFLAYDWQSQTVIPGSPGFVAWGWGGFGPWAGGWAAPTTIVTTGCEATFQMSPSDTVAAFTLRGNACG